MNDITIIIPIHTLNKTTKTTLKKAVDSILKNREGYTYGSLKTVMVVPTNFEYLEFLNKEYVNKHTDFFICENDGKTDFCNQINKGVDYIKENNLSEFFSILEYDDEYAAKWFKMAREYYFGNEDVSVFLPVNVQCNEDKTNWGFCNEVVLASSFSNEIGFIDKDCLENCSSFNLTGGIFKLKDFVEIGGLKPSIQIAFNYEFLLRMTNKNYKVYVVPKEGYMHILGRDGSLVDWCNKNMSEETITKWFELAKRECVYTEDRNKGITQTKKEKLK